MQFSIYLHDEDICPLGISSQFIFLHNSNDLSNLVSQKHLPSSPSAFSQISYEKYNEHDSLRIHF